MSAPSEPLSDHAALGALPTALSSNAGSLDSPADAALRRSLALAGVLTLAICAFGLVARNVLLAARLTDPHPSAINVFYRLFAIHEAPFLWLGVAFALTALVAVRGVRGLPALPRSLVRAGEAVARTPSWIGAAIVLAATTAGTLGVMHGIGLSMDEAGASFQARIFASGRVTAPIPAEWRGLAWWMTPIFVTLKPAEHVWVSAYLPVYAALRALFALLRAEWLTNPVLAAATVVLLSAVCDRLWPGDVRRRRLALVFLLTSAQFLVTSMSGYSMPAHLCLNLLWLYLYLRDDAPSWAALPWVGVLALGLHNPFPHALFAAPFLVRVLRRGRLGWTGYHAAVYVAGAVAWYHWLRFARATDASAAPTGGSLLDTFDVPGAAALFTQGMNLALVASWQTPAFALLALVAVFGWHRLAIHERDVALGVLATIVLYAFFPANQGHGWGYRYAYGVLGNLVLLAAIGANMLWSARARGTVAWLVAASVAATLAIQLPLRLTQVESTVRPHAAALEFIARRPEKLVLVDVSAAWYASDLVRNDPLFGPGPRTSALYPGRGPSPALMPDSIARNAYILGRPGLARLGLYVPPPASKP